MDFFASKEVIPFARKAGTGTKACVVEAAARTARAAEKTFIFVMYLN
jgi:hypothetical protein